MHELALCAGNGGLSLGLGLAVPDSRVVCLVEREAFAAEHLAAKGGPSGLGDAPVWSDLVSFDGRPWRGVVDIVTAGFPCQPFSSAGARRGTSDPRWLWPHIQRIIEEVGPGFVFLENVPGLVRSGLGPVLSGLAALGFDAEWDLFSAEEVGACHIRKRFFLLASHPERQRPPERLSLAGDAREEFPPPNGCGGDDEWGWPTESPVCGADDGPPDRVDRLRSCGNGVVPLQVAFAFQTLARRLGIA
jgi:DNA (cytosine-5)-methyltransferase 1